MAPLQCGKPVRSAVKKAVSLNNMIAYAIGTFA